MIKGGRFGTTEFGVPICEKRAGHQPGSVETNGICKNRDFRHSVSMVFKKFIPWFRQRSFLQVITILIIFYVFKS